MVENVEKFISNIESQILFDRGVLRHAEIGLFKPGRGKIADLPSQMSPVQCSPQRRSAGNNIPCTRMWTTGFALRGFTFATGPTRFGMSVEELPTACIHRSPDSLDRETGRESCDSLDLPSLRQAFRRVAESAIERDGPDVTGHEVVGDVGRRQPPALFWIYEIHQVAERPKNRPGPSRTYTRHKKCHIIRFTFNGDLAGVVDGVGGEQCIRVAVAITDERRRTRAVIGGL